MFFFVCFVMIFLLERSNLLDEYSELDVCKTTSANKWTGKKIKRNGQKINTKCFKLFVKEELIYVNNIHIIIKNVVFINLCAIHSS